jgi:hypothetical protein
LTRPLYYQKKQCPEISVVAQDLSAKSRFTNREPDTATVHLSVRRVRVFVWKDYTRCGKNSKEEKRGVPQGKDSYRNGRNTLPTLIQI